MKARDTSLRVSRFEAEEKARKVTDLESMIREFETMASDLERQITSEEERTGVRDIRHFAYSTFAKAAAQRRDNLRTSVDDLRAKLNAAIAERDAAADKLTKAGSDVRESSRLRHVGDALPDALIS
jgi:flagellar FliJ protein